MIIACAVQLPGLLGAFLVVCRLQFTVFSSLVLHLARPALQLAIRHKQSPAFQLDVGRLRNVRSHKKLLFKKGKWSVVRLITEQVMSIAHTSFSFTFNSPFSLDFVLANDHRSDVIYSLRCV